MMPKTLLVACFGVDVDPWLRELKTQVPAITVRAWPDVGDPKDVGYVLAWNVPTGFWALFPSLEIIFSMGAGVDKVLLDAELPTDLPLVRMVDPSLVGGMREYVAMQVLHHHRMMPAFAAQQQRAEWIPRRPPLAADRRIGILGLGQLGSACAETLLNFGFDVAGWSRGRHRIERMTCFSGRSELGRFAARTEILVCLLPLTSETTGILNSELFAHLPAGAVVINVARGDHLVEQDMLDALRSGHLAGATLDVFQTEPLPLEHPFWSEPGVIVTPHVSALTQPRTAAATLVANLRRHLAGASLSNVVDRTRGY